MIELAWLGVVAAFAALVLVRGVRSTMLSRSAQAGFCLMFSPRGFTRCPFGGPARFTAWHEGHGIDLGSHGLRWRRLAVVDETTMGPGKYAVVISFRMKLLHMQALRKRVEGMAEEAVRRAFRKRVEGMIEEAVRGDAP